MPPSAAPAPTGSPEPAGPPPPAAPTAPPQDAPGATVPPPTSARRFAWQGWAGALVAVLLVLGLVAGLGGFSKGKPYLGAEAKPGEVIRLKQWRARIDTVSLTTITQYSKKKDVIVLGLQLVYTGEKQTDVPDMITIQVGPDRTLLAKGECQHPNGSSYPPMLWMDTTCTFSWDSNKMTPPPRSTDPVAVSVILFDMHLSDGEIYTIRYWQVDAVPSHYVAFSVKDRRS